jgi:hypothetical protein
MFGLLGHTSRELRESQPQLAFPFVFLKDAKEMKPAMTQSNNKDVLKTIVVYFRTSKDDK